MSFDVIKSSSGTEASDPASGGTALYQYPMLGVVKNNVDTKYQGRIEVYLLDGSGKDPDDATNWTIVNFLSPYFGSTTGSAPSDGLGEYINVPSSYGMWYSPPDIGSKVLCIFVDGDPNKGYWVGAIPTTTTLSMVPAIAGTDYIIPNPGEAESYGGATRLPTSGINVNNSDVLTDFNNTIDAPKPIHSYTAAMMMQQGVIRDPIRGPISSSSQRESPSRVGWGVSTPGRPIYEGGFTDQNLIENLEDKNKSNLKVISRRGGHSIVMDDGDFLGRDQLIRIRTALGHQIMMSDDGEVLSIMHRNGQSYIELGKEGTIDMYATNSINMRSQGDINLHADRDIKINAAKNCDLASKTMTLTTEKNFEQLTGGKHELSVGTLYAMSAGGAMSLTSTLAGTFAAGLAAFVKGKFLFLNPIAAPLIPASVKGPPINVHDDTLFDINKTFVAAPGKVPSICTRVPAHYPWTGSNSGVDVKVELSADANFPPLPSSAVQGVNEAAAFAGGSLTSGGTASNVPGTGTRAIGGSLDPEITNGLLAQMATNVRNGPGGSTIASKGYAVVSKQGVKTVLVGNYGQTPEQLELAGVIKPGSAKTINSIVQSGKDPRLAFTDNIFTGQGGVNNFDQLLRAPNVQGEAAVNTLQTSYNYLVQSNVINGGETPEQISGLVLAGATNTPKAVTTQINASRSGSTNTTAQSNKVLQDINTGNQVANYVQKVAGPYSGMATAVSTYQEASGNGVNKARGVRAAAYGAALDSLGGFEARQPLRLSVDAARRGINPLTLYDISRIGLKDTIANEIQLALRRGINAAVQVARNTPVEQLSGSAIYQAAIAASSNSAYTSITQIKNAVIGAAIGIQEGLSFLSRGQFGSAATSIASGLGGLPGGIGIAARQVDNAIQAARILPSQISNIFSTTRTAYETFRSGLEAAKLTNFINNVQVTTKLGQVTTGTVNGIQGVITGIGQGTVTVGVNQLGQLKDNVNSFSSLATNFKNTVGAAVSAAATSAIQIYNAVAAVASLFGGKRKVRVAVRATNTVQRKGVNKRLLRNLWDQKIPPPIGDRITDDFAETIAARKAAIRAQQPNYSGSGVTGYQAGFNPGNYVAGYTPPGSENNVSTAPSTFDDDVFNQQLLDASARTSQLTDKIQAASDKYQYALNNYPKKDPRINQYKLELEALTKQIGNGATTQVLGEGVAINRENAHLFLSGTELVYYRKTGKLLKPINTQISVNSNPLGGISPIDLIPGGTVLPTGGSVDLPGASGIIPGT